MVSTDRGQVLLVGSVVLAVVLIAIVVLLNGVAYTEGVGGGEQDAYDDAKRVEYSVTKDLDAMSSSVADGNGAAEEAELINHAKQFDLHYATIAGASHAATVDVAFSPAASTSSTAIVNTGGTFTPDGGTPNSWWPVEQGGDAKPIREFDMALDTGPGSIPPRGAQPFQVVIDGSWKMSIWQDAGEVHIVVNGTPVSCSSLTSPGATVDIDFVAGEINQDCSFTIVPGGLDSGTHSIQFRSARPGHIYPSGDYMIVLDADYSSVVNRNVFTDPGSPEAKSMISKAGFRYTYETPSMTYESTIKVEVDDS